MLNVMIGFTQTTRIVPTTRKSRNPCMKLLCLRKHVVEAEYLYAKS